MSSEDQAILAKIGKLAGESRRHATRLFRIMIDTDALSHRPN
jgi:hypothetical protein